MNMRFCQRIIHSRTSTADFKHKRLHFGLVDDVGWKARTRYKGSVSKLKRIARDLSGAPNDRFLGNICSELSSLPKIFIAIPIIHLYCF